MSGSAVLGELMLFHDKIGSLTSLCKKIVKKFLPPRFQDAGGSLWGPVNPDHKTSTFNPASPPPVGLRHVPHLLGRRCSNHQVRRSSQTQVASRVRHFTHPPPTIFPPLKQPHNQTIIFLHGRGSSARIFAPDLLDTSVAGLETDNGSKSLRESLPNTRFVFPTAPRSRATIYRRSIINQWFDGSGDWEETVLGHAKETIEFLHRLLREEVLLVGGADRVFLGGFSQGCATALVCMLLWEGDSLGGIVGMCGMLPMGGDLRDILRQGDSGQEGLEYHGTRQERNVDIGEDILEPTGDDNWDPFSHEEDNSQATPLIQALDLLREEIGFPRLESNSEPRVHEMPVFLGHGTEDDNVLLRFAEDASSVLQMAGCEVIFKKYEGLGHCHSPQMLRDVLEFLAREKVC